MNMVQESFFVPGKIISCVSERSTVIGKKLQSPDIVDEMNTDQGGSQDQAECHIRLEKLG